MTGIDSLGTFIIAAIIVIITPGIDTIMVLTRSISLGKKAGLYSAIGVSLGLVIHTIAATFGLSLILAKSAFAFSLVKYLGAAYLFYLGYKSLTAKTNQAEIKSIEVKNTANKKVFNHQSNQSHVHEIKITFTICFNYNYFYRSEIIAGDNADEDVSVPNSLNDRINTYGARYSYQKDRWKGSVLFSNSITNQSLANIDASARYRLDDINEFSFRYQNMNKLPNHNFSLYQSDYTEYNWSENWKNEKINNFEIGATTKWLSAALQFTVLNDHLYFGEKEPKEPLPPSGVDALIVGPNQYANTINYFSLKLNREFKLGNFALDNTLLYQQVNQNDNILNVPEFTTRNSLYYSNHFFKKALFLQTGITFQYFTEYYGNDYNPLIGEFYIQEEKKFGGFPLMDFFINAKIKQFRLFLRAEHFNSSFTGYNFYSAPNYPYRDFTFRLGIIWDFFS